jgi:hypothetical protein
MHTIQKAALLLLLCTICCVSASKHHDADVLVIGSGMAGALASHRVDRHQLTIVSIDRLNSGA